MSGKPWRRGSGILAATLPAALLFSALGADLLRGAETASGLSTNIIPLAYRESEATVVYANVSGTAHPAPFRKEPAVVEGKVVRGVLNFSCEGSNNAVAYLWQRSAGKVFLDLNHNEDLTDDPIWPAQTEGRANLVTLRGVRLPVDTAVGHYHILADLSLWDYSSRQNCGVSVRSFWEGKLALDGQDWQVGLLPDVTHPGGAMANRQLLLRPWANRQQPILGAGSMLDAVPFSPKLFFAGHAWRLQTLFGSTNGEATPTLQFAEQSAALGTLHITGKYVQRLNLPGDDYRVVLDQPAETVKVPVGNYGQPNVLLEHNGSRAHDSQPSVNRPEKYIVSGTAAGVLPVGGPLTNSVALTRHGPDLRLDYQLIGANGQRYELVNEDRSHPPTFAIYQGDKKIASGAFEFG